MTTLAELKTHAATILGDPDMVTFTTSKLGYYVNSGIAELSRIAPQRFVEDIQLIQSTYEYLIHGGDGNLVANPSFESGDETMFDGAYNTIGTSDSELTGGWVPSTTVRALWARSTNAKSGLYIGELLPAANTASHYLYQDIPVTPGSTYYVSGWHWKAATGGKTSRITFDTLDASSVVVTADAVYHDTSAGTPQSMGGSISVPDDGTVAYIRVKLYAITAGNNAADEVFAFEDIRVTEAGQGTLVASNALDQIEVTNVELWTSNYDPARFVRELTPQNQSYVAHSEGGWRYWAGSLRIPYRIMGDTDPAAYFLRVRGYAPYDKLTSSTQVTDLSFELEEALMSYIKVQALESLVFERDLFTQWQTRAGVSDISPASLMNSLSIARDEWRRVRRDIQLLRES